MISTLSLYMDHVAGKLGSLTVSTQYFKSSHPVSRGHCVGRHFSVTPTVPLSMQVYKWVVANLMMGVAG